MAGKPKGSKDSAAKNTFNPPAGGKQPRSQTRGQQEQDPKRRTGQFTGAGEPPLQKK
jgi:hypothetical protein